MFNFKISGIALKKVEEREKAKNAEKSDNCQTDVASILARRVAVEMSDSEDGNANSDSEYDSDDWDESTAWQHRAASRGGLKKLRGSVSGVEEYFFKSQESLATVIDPNEDDADNNESTRDVEKKDNKKTFSRTSSV